jgi:hypothetical protein
MCIHSWPKSDGVSLIPLFSNFRLFRTNFWMEVTFFFFFVQVRKNTDSLNFLIRARAATKIGEFPQQQFEEKKKKVELFNLFTFWQQWRNR